MTNNTANNAKTGPGTPATLAEQIHTLLNMPGQLCKQRGMCCRVAPYKKAIPYEAILELAKEDSEDGRIAHDFVSIFKPYPTQEAARKIAPVFVEEVLARALEKGENPEHISFFKCQYLQKDGRCGIHEDRPTGCRHYPSALPNGILHPGCGYATQAAQNQAQMDHLLRQVGSSLDDMMNAATKT